MKRTEEEKLAQSGYNVKLGDKNYALKPLTLRKSLAWRAKLNPLIVMMLSKDGALENPESLRAAIVDSPDQIAEAVFSYLDLSETEREIILDSANETQLFVAFRWVMMLAFYPLVGARMLIAQVVSPEMIGKVEETIAPKLAQAEAPSTLH